MASQASSRLAGPEGRVIKLVIYLACP